VDDHPVAVVREKGRHEALRDHVHVEKPPVCGTRVSGDISINIDDCFLSSPRTDVRAVAPTG
jgi:hypothetical protein